MKRTIVIYRSTLQRSAIVADAMIEGVGKHGDRVIVTPSGRDKPRGDVAVFYGLHHNMDETFQRYIDAGLHVVFVDLGYWGRRDGGRFLGYHRISVDRRHPSPEQVMSRPMPSDRFDEFEHALLPWKRTNGAIVLAGISEKGANSYGMKYQEWELSAIRRIRAVSDRPIVYRPKPSRADPQTPMAGVGFAQTSIPIEEVISQAHAVVSHHSNVAIDGIIAGVPCFVDDGIALPVSGSGLDKIEDPFYPDEDTRRQWLNNVAYWQWNITEMAEGRVWAWIKEQSLL